MKRGAFQNLPAVDASCDTAALRRVFFGFALNLLHTAPADCQTMQQVRNSVRIKRARPELRLMQEQPGGGQRRVPAALMKRRVTDWVIQAGVHAMRLTSNQRATVVIMYPHLQLGQFVPTQKGGDVDSLFGAGAEKPRYSPRAAPFP